ncbi:hypothetical protein, conserved [Trypanosoma brucei gambiense DAL972]|uniref:Uncharacterized protein n=1 Tax=Trypanosoma brucei gambiense (strain MHOM/CI/86/DAL972) TaxID=679716 RepID=C9ZXW4_TRYB9|nr:hypothetical protein, conserved [Trypanosoma brucei gambiense DAL972]CBH14259.1 hypothetical protein, conserved [Trypanosoma brucei gambiense DAL972]|eukprot:XP_011776529.1 hypothetical protein, conserved [Trypanosoma brucei gambiense DAL972]
MHTLVSYVRSHFLPMSSTDNDIVEEPRSFRKELENSNVRGVLLFVFIDGAASSIWSSQPYQVMVSRLAGDTAVGWVSAAAGVAQIVGALIAGGVRNVPRQVICRLSAFCGLVAVIMSVYGITTQDIMIYYFASALWGMYGGMAFTGTEALFADSVESGKRGFVYNLKWINETTSSCVGSLILLIMTLYLGNDWDTNVLKILMYTGLAVHPTAFFALLGMKDKNILHVDDGCEDCEQFASEASQRRLTDGDSSTKPLLGGTKDIIEEDGWDEESEEEERNCCDYLCTGVTSSWQWLFTVSALPFLLALGNLLISVGSGVTMQYISLYFIKERHVTPIMFFITNIAVNICIALSSTMVRYLSEHHLDRVSATILVRTLSASLLLTMGVIELPLVALLPIYVCRNALMNSTAGVTRSIIMDCARRENRAMWAAFECFVSFMWSASSVMGGYIASAKGYKYTFVITALIHFIAMFVLVPAISGVRQLDRRGKVLR